MKQSLRTFSILRFPATLKPKVLGKEPFIVEGRNFNDFLKSSRDEFQHRMKPELKFAIDNTLSFKSQSLIDSFECIALFLFELKIVDSLWCTSFKQVDSAAKAVISVDTMSKELNGISFSGERLSDPVLEFLSSIPTKQHYQSMLDEDSLKYEIC